MSDDLTLDCSLSLFCVSLQRQLRHIRGIYARNIDLHELVDTFFRVIINGKDMPHVKSLMEERQRIITASAADDSGSCGDRHPAEAAPIALSRRSHSNAHHSWQDPLCIYESEPYYHSLNPMWLCEELEFVKSLPRRKTKSVHNGIAVAADHRLWWNDPDCSNTLFELNNCKGKSKSKAIYMTRWICGHTREQIVLTDISLESIESTPFRHRNHDPTHVS